MMQSIESAVTDFFMFQMNVIVMCLDILRNV